MQMNYKKERGWGIVTKAPDYPRRILQPSSQLVDLTKSTAHFAEGGQVQKVGQ
jgi:hypothetical protein